MTAARLGLIGLALLLSSCGREPTALLAGRWLVGDGEGRFHTLVEVEGDTFRTRGLERGEPRTGRFRARAHGRGHVTLRAPEGDPSIELFLEGPHRGRAVLPGSPGLAFARRVADLPDALAGTWTIGFSDNYHLAGAVMDLSADRWRVTKGPETKRDVRAWPLANRDGLPDLVIAPEGRPTKTLRFAPAGDDGLLAWFAGVDEYFVLHRGVDRPTWLPPEPPTRPNPFLDEGR
ncbi:MAG: hypothetical protein ACQEXJ_10925 [Myxococcota bacterium]